VKYTHRGGDRESKRKTSVNGMIDVSMSNALRDELTRDVATRWYTTDILLTI